MKDTVLVRYGEINTKSRFVGNKMLQVLRQRTEDRLKYENIDFGTVEVGNGRIIVDTDEAETAAPEIGEMPGVASASPAIKTDADIESIKQASDHLEIEDSFGVSTNRAGNHDFSSPDVNRELGSHIEERTGSTVDLDDPGTLVEVDVRHEDAYLFTQRFEGPGGFPVGVGDPVAALVSGGIDSPVAAYKMMVRGSDIVPIYFYNRPVAAEDHLLRFRSAVSKLKRFHPAKKWYFYRVDMDQVNQRLMEIGRGRMVVHRQLMFRVAERIAEKEGLQSLVTGESVGQKSSQTVSNLDVTSSIVDMNILRPLLGFSKPEIVEISRKIGSFEDATVDSACESLAPESPATSIGKAEIADLRAEIGFEQLVDEAVKSAEKVEI